MILVEDNDNPMEAFRKMQEQFKSRAREDLKRKRDLIKKQKEIEDDLQILEKRKQEYDGYEVNYEGTDEQIMLFEERKRKKIKQIEIEISNPEPTDKRLLFLQETLQNVYTGKCNHIFLWLNESVFQSQMQIISNCIMFSEFSCSTIYVTSSCDFTRQKMCDIILDSCEEVFETLNYTLTFECKFNRSAVLLHDKKEIEKNIEIYCNEQSNTRTNIRVQGQFDTWNGKPVIILYIPEVHKYDARDLVKYMKTVHISLQRFQSENCKVLILMSTNAKSDIVTQLSHSQNGTEEIDKSDIFAKAVIQTDKWNVEHSHQLLNTNKNGNEIFIGLPTMSRQFFPFFCTFYLTQTIGERLKKIWNSCVTNIPFEIGFIFSQNFNYASLESFIELCKKIIQDIERGAEKMYKRNTCLLNCKASLYQENEIRFSLDDASRVCYYRLPKSWKMNKEAIENTKMQIENITGKYDMKMKSNIPADLGNNLGVMVADSPHSLSISNQMIKNFENSLITVEPKNSVLRYNTLSSILSGPPNYAFQWGERLLNLIWEDHKKIEEIETRLSKLEKSKEIVTSERVRNGGIYERKNKNGKLIGYIIRYPCEKNNWKFIQKYVAPKKIINNKEVYTTRDELELISKELGLSEIVIKKSFERLDM